MVERTNVLHVAPAGSQQPGSEVTHTNATIEYTLCGQLVGTIITQACSIEEADINDISATPTHF